MRAVVVFVIAKVALSAAPALAIRFRAELPQAPLSPECERLFQSLEEKPAVSVGHSNSAALFAEYEKVGPLTRKEFLEKSRAFYLMKVEDQRRILPFLIEKVTDLDGETLAHAIEIFHAPTDRVALAEHSFSRIVGPQSKDLLQVLKTLSIASPSQKAELVEANIGRIHDISGDTVVEVLKATQGATQINKLAFECYAKILSPSFDDYLKVAPLLEPNGIIRKGFFFNFAVQKFQFRGKSLALALEKTYPPTLAGRTVAAREVFGSIRDPKVEDLTEVLRAISKARYKKEEVLEFLSAHLHRLGPYGAESAIAIVESATTAPLRKNILEMVRSRLGPEDAKTFDHHFQKLRNSH